MQTSKVKTKDGSVVDLVDGRITDSDISTWNAKQGVVSAGDNVTIDNGVISSNQVFNVTYGTTTYAEIKAAYEAGKICVMTDGTFNYSLLYVNAEAAWFQCVYSFDLTMRTAAVTPENTWQSGTFELELKQTFDDVPTADSNNPVKSKGIKSALDDKQDALDNAGDKSTPVYIAGGKAVPIDFVASPSVGTGTNPVNGGRYFYAVNDHTHANKDVLDGITAAKVATWDDASGDDWYYFTSGSETMECFYIGYSDAVVGEDQLCTGSFMVYLRTLTTVGLYVVDIHTRYSSGVRVFTVRRLDGNGDQGFGIYPVGMSEEPVYRYGFYFCFDASNYCVLRVKPLWTSQLIVSVAWITDSETIKTVRGNNGSADENPYMFPALPRRVSISSNGGKISTAGGKYTTSFAAKNSRIFGGSIDISVEFNLFLVGQGGEHYNIAKMTVGILDNTGAGKYYKYVAVPMGTCGMPIVAQRVSVRFSYTDIGSVFRDGFQVAFSLPASYTFDTGAYLQISDVVVTGINY